VPCLIALLALVSPRLALVALWLFGDLLERAYDEWIIPVIGFFLLPWTTLAYAVMWSLSTNRVSGLEWLVVAFAVLVDLGAFGRGRRYAESRG
jgi:hypothetical protein